MREYNGSIGNDLCGITVKTLIEMDLAELRNDDAPMLTNDQLMPL